MGLINPWTMTYTKNNWALNNGTAAPSLKSMHLTLTVFICDSCQICRASLCAERANNFTNTRNTRMRKSVNLESQGSLPSDDTASLRTTFTNSTPRCLLGGPTVTINKYKKYSTNYYTVITMIVQVVCFCFAAMQFQERMTSKDKVFPDFPQKTPLV